jgi:hypothetical protein
MGTSRVLSQLFDGGSRSGGKGRQHEDTHGGDASSGVAKKAGTTTPPPTTLTAATHLPTAASTTRAVSRWTESGD